jgi:putative NADH-flavin reductase
MLSVLYEIRKQYTGKLNTMKLTILGATGGTGTCLVEQAIAAGHEVTAVVRDPARLALPNGPAVLGGPTPAGRLAVPAGQRLRIVTADIMDPAAIIPAVTGADAVLSAVGPHGTGPTTVSQDSCRSIIQAMRKTGARRFLVVTGSIVADEGESPYLRYLLKPLVRGTLLRHVCADMRRAEDEIRASSLDWTIVRPPSLTGQIARGRYRTAIDRNLPHGFRISRADVAACMLTLIGDPMTVHRHVGIAN